MKVLLVEDEIRLARAIQKGLRADGFQVALSHDGYDGLRLARTNTYDLIVLDIMLPGISGYRVCQELRSAGVWTPVLMLTAKDGEYDEADAFDLGADDYLTKPFSYVVLVARLRALLRRGAPVRPTVLTAGSLTLDPAAHRACRGDEVLPLTPTEFSLLHLLMRHQGEVVSKAQILDSVWDRDYGDDNIVEVYVRYLRKKIDVPFGVRTIATVRGVGYRLSSS
ncbi:MAG: response regulator receiver [Nocardioides sp.]|nr:response regulator receiver [Nocardioides sp.]